MSTMRTAPTRLTRPSPTRGARLSWPASLIVGFVATAGAMTTMFWLRSAYQIRTLPERVMEWALLYVSPVTLEQGLAQFGAQAKVYALYVAVAGMALILQAIGTALVRFGRSPWVLLTCGPVLFLLAMGVIMPLTGGGPFGLDLLQDWRLVNAGYLVVGLTFAALLVVGWLAVVGPTRELVGARGSPTRRSDGGGATRRAALAALGTTALAAAATIWLGQRG